jgi:hypothetical protein
MESGGDLDSQTGLFTNAGMRGPEVVDHAMMANRQNVISNLLNSDHLLLRGMAYSGVAVFAVGAAAYAFGRAPYDTWKHSKETTENRERADAA